MTVEEKAKAYDEALDRAIELYEKDSVFDSEKTLIRCIFPELAESEDERIRKALIEMVHDTTGDELWIDYNVHKEEALAWLEKQGEQKSTDEPKFKVKYAGSEYNVLEVKDIAGVTFYGIEDEPNHIDYVKAENCDSGYAIKENCSPYPTKPAVFSEKKPTAWSDEDDYNLQCMIAKVTYDIQKGNVGRNNELMDWLKSLKDRMQGKEEKK